MEGISKAFGGKSVLRQIREEFAPGRFVALLGLNGAGKSTLLHCLAGIVSLSEGRVHFDGQPFGRECVDLRRRFAFLPDFPLFFPTMNALQHIGMVLRLYGKDTPGAEERVVELLRSFDLLPVAEAALPSLSRGQLYKVALAAVIAANPDLWMLDEPMASGMDAMGLREFRSRAAPRPMPGRRSFTPRRSFPWPSNSPTKCSCSIRAACMRGGGVLTAYFRRTGRTPGLAARRAMSLGSREFVGGLRRRGTAGGADPSRVAPGSAPHFLRQDPPALPSGPAPFHSPLDRLSWILRAGHRVPARARPLAHDPALGVQSLLDPRGPVSAILHGPHRGARLRRPPGGLPAGLWRGRLRCLSHLALAAPRCAGRGGIRRSRAGSGAGAVVGRAARGVAHLALGPGHGHHPGVALAPDRLPNLRRNSPYAGLCGLAPFAKHRAAGLGANGARVSSARVGDAAGLGGASGGRVGGKNSAIAFIPLGLLVFWLALAVPCYRSIVDRYAFWEPESPIPTDPPPDDAPLDARA